MTMTTENHLQLPWVVGEDFLIYLSHENHFYYKEFPKVIHSVPYSLGNSTGHVTHRYFKTVIKIPDVKTLITSPIYPLDSWWTTVNSRWFSCLKLFCCLFNVIPPIWSVRLTCRSICVQLIWTVKSFQFTRVGAVRVHIILCLYCSVMPNFKPCVVFCCSQERSTALVPEIMTRTVWLLLRWLWTFPSEWNMICPQCHINHIVHVLCLPPWYPIQSIHFVVLVHIFICCWLVTNNGD